MLEKKRQVSFLLVCNFPGGFIHIISSLEGPNARG